MQGQRRDVPWYQPRRIRAWQVIAGILIAAMGLFLIGWAFVPSVNEVMDGIYRRWVLRVPENAERGREMRRRLREFEEADRLHKERYGY